LRAIGADPPDPYGALPYGGRHFDASPLVCGKKGGPCGDERFHLGEGIVVVYPVVVVVMCGR
jgi:hypothetical protein